MMKVLTTAEANALEGLPLDAKRIGKAYVCPVMFDTTRLTHVYIAVNTLESPGIVRVPVMMGEYMSGYNKPSDTYWWEICLPANCQAFSALKLPTLALSSSVHLIFSPLEEATEQSIYRMSSTAFSFTLLGGVQAVDWCAVVGFEMDGIEEYIPPAGHATQLGERLPHTNRFVGRLPTTAVTRHPPQSVYCNDTAVMAAVELAMRTMVSGAARWRLQLEVTALLDRALAGEFDEDVSTQ